MEAIANNVGKKQEKTGANMNRRDFPEVGKGMLNEASVTSIRNGGRGFQVPFARKVNWVTMVRYCKNWAKHPMNIALLVWLFCVAACLVVIFMFMAGFLNQIIPNSTVRKRWTEIFNQILNALFTIMCLYQHPRISHQLVLLCCWRLVDINELRNTYSKNGTRTPHERVHMMFVVILLHITCLAQYGYCALYWVYTINTRPAWPQIFFIVLGIAAPVTAGLYTVFGPLGRNTEAENDEEAQRQVAVTTNTDVNGPKQNRQRVVATSPEWVGGIFDCCDDLSVCYLSFFCTFCVFGWNMERLGFGNLYVHIITFIIFCSAPVIVFSVTALNINDYTVRYMMAIVGIVLCLFGLLYGGYWRIQMRKKFKLPMNPFWFGYPAIADFMQWLFCWSCSLAQEVRTANFYDVDGDSFYRKESEDGSQQVIVPLPRENRVGLAALPSFVSPMIHCTADLDDHLEILQNTTEGEIHEVVRDEMMRPPFQSVMLVEDR